MKLLALFIVFIMLASCSSEEKVINPVKDGRLLTVSTDAGGYSLKGVEVPTGIVIEEDYFRKYFASEATNKITAIADNGFDIFFFMPDEMKILVLDKKEMMMKAVIDFSSYGLKPYTATFPNATDAYVLSQESNDVTIIDLTVYEIAHNIKCGIKPVAIASYENQIHIADFSANLVHVIDTRTRQIAATIPVHPGPSFIRFTDDGNLSIVISSGVSGIEPNMTKSEARATFINKQTRTVEAVTDIGFGQIAPVDQYPRGFEITQKDWGFVPTQSGLFRLDLRNPEKIALMKRIPFTGIAYNRDESELILFISDEPSEIFLADDSNADIYETFKFNGKIFAIYPN